MSNGPLDVDRTRKRMRSFSMGVLASLAGLFCHAFVVTPPTPAGFAASVTEDVILAACGIYCLVMAIRCAKALPREPADSSGKQEPARKKEFPDDPY